MDLMKLACVMRSWARLNLYLLSAWNPAGRTPRFVQERDKTKLSLPQIWHFMHRIHVGCVWGRTCYCGSAFSCMFTLCQMSANSSNPMNNYIKALYYQLPFNKHILHQKAYNAATSVRPSKSRFIQYLAGRSVWKLCATAIQRFFFF